MATITLRPNEDISTQIEISYPDAHWDAINDVTPDEDATYILHQSGTAEDYIGLENSGASGVISSVKLYARGYVLYLEIGSHCYVKLFTHANKYGNIDCQNEHPWQTYNQTFTTNPHTGLAWTWAEINALQLYIQFVATDHVGLTQAYIVVTYSVAPTVSTQAVTNIGEHTATGNGNITATGGLNATRRGFCYMEGDSGDPDTSDSVAYDEGSFGAGAYTKGLTGLIAGTDYRVRAYAISPAGTGYGTTVGFTTDKSAPTVTTQSPTNVLPTTVTANGNITALGGENATVRGFKYGLTKVNTWDAHDDGSFEAGAYTKGLTGLSANTTYWIRAYATNTIGTSYGAWVEFQTAAAGTIPTGTNLFICADLSGYSYQLMKSETDDGEEYTAYFVISTDLTNKQGLSFYKRILDLHLYFRSEDSGTATIYVKRDNEAEWQEVGSVSLTGTEDIIVKHLAPDIRAKVFLFKITAANFFRFLGCLFESLPEEMR